MALSFVSCFMNLEHKNTGIRSLHNRFLRNQVEERASLELINVYCSISWVFLVYSTGIFRQTSLKKNSLCFPAVSSCLSRKKNYTISFQHVFRSSIHGGFCAKSMYGFMHLYMFKERTQ